jgi:hypothetical protein
MPCTARRQCAQGPTGFAGVSERESPESEAAPWQGIAEWKSRGVMGRARGRQARAQNEPAKITNVKNGPANQRLLLAPMAILDDAKYYTPFANSRGRGGVTRSGSQAAGPEKPQKIVFQTNDIQMADRFRVIRVTRPKIFHFLETNLKMATAVHEHVHVNVNEIRARGR